MKKKILISISLTIVVLFGGLFCYTHLVEQRSLTSWIAERYLWVSGTRVTKGQMTSKHYLSEAQKQSKNYKIPKVTTDQKIATIKGMRVVTWNDKSNKKQRVLLYLHGGAYISEASKIQMAGINNIAKKLNAKVIMPIYPLAPRYTYKMAYSKLGLLYKKTLKTTQNSQKITLIGDSAGGGLALGFSMYARDHQLQQPKDIILLSPWLDVSMTNPSIKKYEKVDPMLTTWSLRVAGKAWAGSKTAMYKPYVSPIYGNFKHLGRISIFVGTHEEFLSDNQKLNKILTQEKISHTYVQADKMNHVYAVYPTPEAKKAQTRIAKIIKR